MGYDGLSRTFSGDPNYDGSRDIVFHTASREYFLNLKHILAPHGYNIIDPTDVARREFEEAQAFQAGELDDLERRGEEGTAKVSLN